MPDEENAGGRPKSNPPLAKPASSRPPPIPEAARRATLQPEPPIFRDPSVPPVQPKSPRQEEFTGVGNFDGPPYTRWDILDPTSLIKTTLQGARDNDPTREIASDTDDIDIDVEVEVPDARTDQEKKTALALQRNLAAQAVLDAADAKLREAEKKSVETEQLRARAATDAAEALRLKDEEAASLEAASRAAAEAEQLRVTAKQAADAAEQERERERVAKEEATALSVARDAQEKHAATMHLATITKLRALTENARAEAAVREARGIKQTTTIHVYIYDCNNANGKPMAHLLKGKLRYAVGGNGDLPLPFNKAQTACQISVDGFGAVMAQRVTDDFSLRVNEVTAKHAILEEGFFFKVGDRDTRYTIVIAKIEREDMLTADPTMALDESQILKAAVPPLAPKAAGVDMRKTMISSRGASRQAIAVVLGIGFIALSALAMAIWSQLKKPLNESAIATSTESSAHTAETKPEITVPRVKDVREPQVEKPTELPRNCNERRREPATRANIDLFPDGNQDINHFRIRASGTEASAANTTSAGCEPRVMFEGRMYRPKPSQYKDGFWVIDLENLPAGTSAYISYVP